MAKYSYAEMLSIVDNIMGQCSTSAGECVDTSIKSVSDISRVVYSQYANANTGTLQIFFYTKGKEGNNRPYTYNKRLSRAKYNLIHDLIDAIVKHEQDNEVDLDNLIVEDF